MDDGDIAEIEELRGQCRLLRGDDARVARWRCWRMMERRLSVNLIASPEFDKKLQDVSA